MPETHEKPYCIQQRVGGHPLRPAQKYGLKPGSEVRIVDYGGVLAIIPAFLEPVQAAAGMLKSAKKLTAALLVEHNRER